MCEHFKLVDTMSVNWDYLPEVILAQIFSYLSTTEKLSINGVCSSWSRACMRSEVWHSFEISEEDLLDGIDDAVDGRPEDFDILRGNEIDIKWEQLVDTLVELIQNVGRYFRNVKLYFRRIFSNKLLNSLAENCCNIEFLKIQQWQLGVNIVRNHDSSCKQCIYTLLQRNVRLKSLKIRDIDRGNNVSEQKQPLPIGASHSSTLKTLHFIQSFKGNNLGNLMYLINLRELAMEPQALSYSLLHHLAGKQLTDLHIVAVSKHMEFYNEALQDWQWKDIARQGPKLRVHCHFGVNHEWTEKEIMLKEYMPVQSLKYQKWKQLDYTSLHRLVCRYSSTLEVFIDTSLSMKSFDKAFLYRNDEVEASILNMVSVCTKLKTLAVKTKLCSGTVLSMLYLNKDLDILITEEQISYRTQSQDLNLPYPIWNIVTDGCTDRDSFEMAVIELTGKRWHFHQKGELFNIMFNTHLPFV